MDRLFQRAGNYVCTVLLLSILSGCSSIAVLPDDEQNSGSFYSVTVLFVTDRAVSVEEDDPIFYSDRRGTVEYGRATVDLPVEVAADDSGRKWWAPSLYGNKRISDARIAGIDPLTRADFFAVLKETANSLPLSVKQTLAGNEQRSATAESDKSVLLYVHGYNTGFEEAVLRTAQLWSDTDHGGQAVLFSWPSTISIAAYAGDEINVEWATPHLTDLLKAIQQETAIVRSNLIAHSMGSRALTEALIDVESETGRITSIQHLVMAAPDIDTDIFKRDIAPKLITDGRQITLYASARDRALDISHQLHRHPRAGDVGEKVMLYPGIDTIDATAVDTSFLGHNYYGENRAIVADMRQMFAGNLPPEQRDRMQPVRVEDGLYWRMTPEADAKAGSGGAKE